MALVLIFIFLSFKSRRHFPLMAVVTFCFVLEIYAIIFALPLQFKNLKIEKASKKNFLNKGLLFFIFSDIVLLIIFLIFKTDFTNKPFSSYCQKYPCGAVSFLREHQEYDKQNLFNQYNWGGYLIHELPERLLFIDGRLPQVQYLQSTFLEEYFAFFKEGKTSSETNEIIKNRLEEQQISLVLISTVDKEMKIKKWEKIIFSLKEEDFKAKNNLRLYLASSTDWHLVYQDETATIYSRVNSLQ
jgi:hypothetical protein